MHWGVPIDHPTSPKSYLFAAHDCVCFFFAQMAALKMSTCFEGPFTLPDLAASAGPSLTQGQATRRKGAPARYLLAMGRLNSLRLALASSREMWLWVIAYASI